MPVLGTVEDMHAILWLFNSQEEFKIISMCETTQEAWDTLEATHAGTKIVKNLKLQMLTSRFQEIRMRDDETFDEFLC